MQWQTNQASSGGARSQLLYVTVAPGEAVSLPRNTRLQVQAVSGTAHITHTGRDLLLWSGDTENLEVVSKEWGAPVLTALGNHSATITMQTERNEVGWHWWIERQQAAPRDEAKTTFWTRWRERSSGKSAMVNRSCASTSC